MGQAQVDDCDVHVLSALAGSSDEPRRIDLVVRYWPWRDQTVAERLRRVDNRRMQ